MKTNSALHSQAHLQRLAAIVAPDALTVWDEVDAARRATIARSLSPGQVPAVVVAPDTQAELAQTIACAAEHGWTVLPCGGGSKLHWGGLTHKIDLVVDTRKLDRLIDHAIGDLTVTVEAGMSFAALQAQLATAGQFLAIDPSFPETATIGGIVATAESGSWRHRFNSVRDMVLGITMVRHDGERVKAGGRVVKNVAGYDLMKLLTGSYGTLGILAQVTFRVYPIQPVSQTAIVRGNADHLAQAATTLLTSALTPTAVDAQLNDGEISLVVRFQSVAESVALQIARLTELATSLGLVTTVLSAEAERSLWQTAAHWMQPEPASERFMAGKLGVRSTAAIPALSHLSTVLPNPSAIVHLGSGLGQIAVNTARSTQMLEARSYLQSLGGYLTILDAPIDLKQQMDLWGYPGNALELMKRVKQQFDPHSRLSPHRFVGGI